MATTPSNHRNLCGISYLLVIALCLSSCVGIKNLNKTNSKPLAAFDSKQMSDFLDAEKLRLNNSSNAIKAYLNFVKQYPQNATGHYNLSRAYYAKNQFQNAAAYADECVKLAPKNKYFWEYNARVWSLADNPSKAEYAYNRLLKLEPDNLDYIYNQIWFYAKHKNFDKSLRLIHNVQSRFGYDDDLIILKKNIFLHQSKVDSAIKELELLSSRNKLNPQYLIEEINIYKSYNQHKKAEFLYERLKKEYPDNPLSLLALTEYYQSMNNPAMADSFMLHVMQNEHLDVNTRIGFILPYLRSSQNTIPDSLNAAKCLTWLRALHQKYPTNKEINTLLGDALYQNKHTEEALTSYKFALTLDTFNFDTWNKILTIHLQEQKYDSVIRYAKKSNELFPSRALPHFYLGISYQNKKQFERSTQSLSKALTLSNNKELSAQIFSLLGESYHALQRFSLSDSCYREAIKINPNDATSLNNFAYYLSLRNEQLDEAERMSKKSLELEPDNPSFLDTFGWIQYKKGDYEEAKKYISKAIEVDTTQSDATLYEHLGDVYLKLNDKLNAINSWEKALKIDKNNSLIKQKINDAK